MRIREIEIIGLIGATPEGGWSNELKPDDSVHTLVVVRTDEGVDGYGGAFSPMPAWCEPQLRYWNRSGEAKIRSNPSGSAKSSISTPSGSAGAAR